MGITDIDRMLHVVGGLDRFLVRVRDPALRRVGLGRDQWQVLRLLADGQGHAMGEIAGIIGLTGATATRVVDSLVQDTQAYRRSDPVDRRRTLIYLAEPGQELLGQTEQAMAEQIRTLLTGLEPDERADLVGLLERLTSGAALLDDTRVDPGTVTPSG